MNIPIRYPVAVTVAAVVAFAATPGIWALLTALAAANLYLAVHQWIGGPDVQER